jgi:hypothetical protein
MALRVLTAPRFALTQQHIASVRFSLSLRNFGAHFSL